jgi:hypothetical protein
MDDGFGHVQPVATMLEDDSVINERLSNETTCEEAMLGGKFGRMTCYELE